jgi:D-lactate dehydrogenase (cytochrome)
MIIKKDKSIIQNYFEDNSGVVGSNADFVAVAETEKDVLLFLSEMSKLRLPVTIAGALTGNTAAGLAFGGAVLSLEKLNKIGEIKKIYDNIALITVQAGSRVCDIKSKVQSENWMYPPDPTERNAFIGGNISTNASGSRGFKFGATRNYVTALKVVFSDGSCSFIERGEYFADKNGEIIFGTSSGKKCLKLPRYCLPDIKNAVGYYNYPNSDLIDILIGSEGTICVILEAVLKLIPNFKDIFGGIIFFNTCDSAYKFVNKIKSISEKTKKEKLKNSINAMSLEYFDKNALSMVKNDYSTLPIEGVEVGIMFEQDVSEKDNFDVLMGKWIDVINSGDADIDLEKVWFASSSAEQDKIIAFRHRIPERVNELLRENKFSKIGTDFAVPEGKVHEIIDFCDMAFKKTGNFNLIFGHIGENHLHANILASNEVEHKKCRQLYRHIVRKVIELGGTISAEHGIGKLKHVFLEEMVGEKGLREMAKFKMSIDNSGILGQDNIFPKKYLF